MSKIIRSKSALVDWRLDFGGHQSGGRCSALSAGMIKEDGHHISDFGTTALC